MVKHYCTSSGRDVITKFLETCSQDIKNDYFDAVALLDAGKTLEMPLSRNLFNICLGLHELRLKDSGGQVRFIYYMKRGSNIFVLHAFKKKTEELPEKEKKLILRRIREV